MEHPENQYLEIIKKILKTGKRKNDRTGVGTLSIFGEMMRYSLEDNVFPLITTKRVAYKSIVEELLFFLRGDTDSKILEKNGINIWKKNGERKFLDSVGIDREEGDLGPIYGFQWRHFGAKYKTCHDDYKNQGIDQIKNVIEMIKNNPNDRRMLVCSWNPLDISKMVLPPCHLLFQFNVNDGKLNCCMYQRSCDMGLGVPFNIGSYSLLTIMIAHITDLCPGEFIHFMGDCHVYINHVDALKEQVSRIPRKFPKIFVNPKDKRSNLEDFKYEDFELVGYEPWPTIKMDLNP